MPAKDPFAPGRRAWGWSAGQSGSTGGVNWETWENTPEPVVGMVGPAPVIVHPLVGRPASRGCCHTLLECERVNLSTSIDFGLR